MRPPTGAAKPGDGHVPGPPECTRLERRGRERRKEVVGRGGEVRHLRDLVRDVGPDLRRVVAGGIEAAAIPAADQTVGVGDQLAGGGAAPDRETVVPAFQRDRPGAVPSAKLPESVALGPALALGDRRTGRDLAPGGLGEPGALELAGVVAWRVPALDRAGRRQRRGEEPDPGGRDAAQASAMKG